MEGPKSLLTGASLDLASRPSPPLTVASVHLTTHIASSAGNAGGAGTANEVCALPALECTLITCLQAKKRCFSTMCNHRWNTQRFEVAGTMLA